MKVLCKKDVLKNLVKSSGKQLINLSLIKRLRHWYFPVVFAKYLIFAVQIN